MKQYISNSGYQFKNFNEVMDYMKNTHNSVSLKGVDGFRAAILHNDNYELRIFKVNKGHTADWEFTYNLGQRMTANKAAFVETMLDRMAEMA